MGDSLRSLSKIQFNENKCLLCLKLYDSDDSNDTEEKRLQFQRQSRNSHESFFRSFPDPKLYQKDEMDSSSLFLK